ncbi:hypothetical protein TSUD_244560 [Trifolium subterraneum]|uniref:Uncharacterized protein n=1 Tax=Trifolium subterraneum TaxID=3900 RepID=A0A2Z6PSH5_TRISU|nr:hypothetical protein TSUD_244560 [Trifolium subterraneum]
MEEVMNFIMRAFELAKDHEQELPNISNNPEMLFSSIDEVEKAFSSAKERLMMMLSSQHDTTTTTSKASNSFAQILSHDVFMQNNHDHGQMGGSGTSMHAHSMDQLLLMQHSFEMLRSRGTLMIGEMGGRDVEGLEKSKGSEGEMQGIEEPPSRPKKRLLLLGQSHQVSVVES